MTAYEMAKQYYPRLWSKVRVKALADKGLITPFEYELITSEAYKVEV